PRVAVSWSARWARRISGVRPVRATERVGSDRTETMVMPDDGLSLGERCVLLVLMAEARQLTNAELQALAGIKLDGRNRKRLNERGLVRSVLVGRAFVHELTDRG